MKPKASQPGKRDLLSLRGLSMQEISDLIQKGLGFKALPRSSPEAQPLKGKTLGLLFEKSSTRTRVSFEVAMYHLGGHTVALSMEELHLLRGETIQDTASVLSKYLDGIVIRTFGQDKLEQWGRAASIPVINGLTDLHHPCQTLGDLLTIKEHFGDLKGLKLAYVGDGNNVAHSLIEGAVKTGMHISLACPKGYEPNRAIVEAARKEASQTGAIIELVQDPKQAASKADILYTDVWVSMGKEREGKQRLKKLRPYQINARLLDLAKSQAVVMHCLPAHRDQEISAEVMDGPRSIVWTQAENRLHIQKAILAWLLGAHSGVQ